MLISPLACKATIAQVVAVVGGINDHGVLIQSTSLEMFDQASQLIVYAAEHPAVIPGGEKIGSKECFGKGVFVKASGEQMFRCEPFKRIIGGQ